ncbi:MAG: fumarate hydratase [Firmicutes bacterium]|nr:fumarate hydratase [Candidatus Fermentithermobacillaceae bacterium]
MRKIQATQVTETVKQLFLRANFYIGQDVLNSLKEMEKVEKSPLGKRVLQQIIENDELAAKEEIAICQDTGMAVLFVEYGQDVHVVGGNFQDAIDEGVRQAYVQGYLRKSVVADPLFDRKNTGDNTPSVTHVRIVPGDKIKFLVMPKGFGSENMSAMKMLKPADGVEGVKAFVIETVKKAGPNPCPPVIVGVGIGGTTDKVTQLAKLATLREVGKRHPDPRYAKLEEELLEAVNKTGIGPAGLGGTTTALAVNIEHYPTHIAGLPVAVNIVCHAARRAEAVI